MITSITTILNLNEELKTNLIEVRRRKYDEKQLFGPENEYSLKGLFAGLQSFTTDLNFLVNNENFFIKVSTSIERNSIINILTNINSYLQTNQFATIPLQIDQLKVVLNQYNLRIRNNYFVSFNEEIDNLKKRAFELDQRLIQTKTTQSDIEAIFNDVGISNQTFKLNLEEFEANIATQEKKLKNLDAIITTSETTLARIDEIKDAADISSTTIQTNEASFKSFIDKIVERERQLDRQANRTKDYDQKLAEYTDERMKIIENAKQLIASAKEALQYKTAEGMSAAFQTKEIASSNWKLTFGWLIAAIALLLGAISIGVWQLYSNDHNIYQIIGRISMISLIVIAATFCAKQYIKQKSLIEDYAYKSVLSKSFIGFAEEIKKHNDEDAYNQFIALALKEILQDPLRNREDAKSKSSSISSKGIEEVTNLLTALSKFKSIG